MQITIDQSNRPFDYTFPGYPHHFDPAFQGKIRIDGKELPLQIGFRRRTTRGKERMKARGREFQGSLRYPSSNRAFR